MSRYYFTVPDHHMELFGNNIPVKDTTIKKAIFGFDKVELWARSPKEERKDASKYIRDIDVYQLDGVATKEIEEGGWRNLLESVREIGITTPLLVIERTSGDDTLYHIIEGHHRAAVAIKLGMKTVPTVVIRVDEDYTIKMLEAEERT